MKFFGRRGDRLGDDHDAPRSDEDLIRALVAAGGGAARRHQFDLVPGEVSTKSNATDLVTKADRDAEAAMVALLAAERPHDAVVGEEGTARPGTSGRTWVLDPVDGTYNFARGGDRWCTAAALLEDETPVLGAVAAAGLGSLWTGGPGRGVRFNLAAVPPRGDVPLRDAALATYLHPPYHGTAVGQTWRRLVAGVATLRMTGSGSLDCVDVARGVADLSVQHSVPLWDSAPGEALVRALGGVSARVDADGVEWFLLGAPTAVAEAVALLRAG